MYQQEITVLNPDGIHARPASDFVKLAGNFPCKITLQRTGEKETYNAKSIIMLLSLGLKQGETAILSADGKDEESAVHALAELFANLKD